MRTPGQGHVPLPCVHLSLCLFLCLCLCRSVSLSTSRYCLSLSVCLCLHLSISVSPFLLISLLLSVSISLSLSDSIFPTLCLSISLLSSVSFCLSVSLWVFLSPAGPACVKTGPLVGSRLPILDTHFLSPCRELAQLTPSCPESRAAPEALACRAPSWGWGWGWPGLGKRVGPTGQARWVTSGPPPARPAPPQPRCLSAGRSGDLGGH